MVLADVRFGSQFHFLKNYEESVLELVGGPLVSSPNFWVGDAVQVHQFWDFHSDVDFWFL
jgi:hypothetical protein